MTPFSVNEIPDSTNCVYRAKTAKRAAAPATKTELNPRVLAPLTKTGIVVEAGFVVVAGAVVVVHVVVEEGVTVVTTTVVQVEVFPLVVIVVTQVVVVVMGLATQMLCLQTQAQG